MNHLFKFIATLTFLFLIVPSVSASGGLFIQPTPHEARETGSNPSIWVLNNENRASEINDLGVVLTNDTDKETVIHIEVGNIFANGLETAFSKETTYNESSMIDNEFQMTKYVKGLPEKVVLAPKESKTLTFSLKNIPNIDGEILGGITFLQDPVETTQTQDGVNISTRTQFTKVIRINNSKTDALSPLKWEKAEVISKVGKPQIRFDLTNPNAYVVKKDETSIKVVDSKGNIISEETSNLFIPPTAKTTAEMPVVHEDGSPLEGGKYTLVIGSDELNIPFEIKEKELRKMDPVYKQDQDDKGLPAWVKFTLIGLIGLVLVLVIALFRRKKQV